jgi:hypothetical protein
MGTACHKKLWQIAWELWQHRNNEEHKDDQEKIQHVQIIQEEIQLGTENFLKLNKLFEAKEIEKVKSNNSGYMRAWIRLVQAIRKREHKREDETGGVRQMRTLMY